MMLSFCSHATIMGARRSRDLVTGQLYGFLRCVLPQDNDAHCLVIKQLGYFGHSFVLVNPSLLKPTLSNSVSDINVGNGGLARHSYRRLSFTTKSDCSR